jgi:hypothetical protein
VVGRKVRVQHGMEVVLRKGDGVGEGAVGERQA